MKKKIFYSTITFLFAISAITANASSDIKGIKEKVAGMTEAQKEERIQQIQQRAEEIKAMDKSQLSKIERKDLRDELRNMNKEVKAERRGNGIYISLGALIIIILLLVLIL
jgi:TolA-binding protein